MPCGCNLVNKNFEEQLNVETIENNVKQIRTSAEITKLLYKLDDELCDLNISEEKKMKLMRNYKLQLENENIPCINTFIALLNKTEIPSNHIEMLEDIYRKQVIKKNILENANEYDSLLFISELSDRRFSKIKTGYLWKAKTIKFSNCIKHLQDTERLHIVRCNEYESFMEKNKIYFDDEEHFNIPKRDVLYRKINNYYFVSNKDYFEKYTDFYFKLYTNIFTLFNLKKIEVTYHNNLHKISETAVGANILGSQIQNKVTSSTEEKNDKWETRTFEPNNIDATINCRDFNNCTGKYEEINFIKDLMPANLKKDMYNPSCILDLIKNRTKSTLTKFEQIQTIENTNRVNIEKSLKTHFNITTLPVELFGSSKTSDYINKRVVFSMEFYDMLNQKDISDNSDSNNETQEKNESSQSNNKLPLGKLGTMVLDENGRPRLINKHVLGWACMKRHDIIHKWSVSAGVTKNDGKVYIGRIDKSPGKMIKSINSENNNDDRIWNFIVQGIGTTNSSQSGQVFMTNLNYEWIEITKGSEIPVNSIYNGKDENDDQVWIGKSLLDEPGKIMCKIPEKGRPLMDKLWCHGSWCSHKKGYILTIKDFKKELYLNELPIVNHYSDFN